MGFFPCFYIFAQFTMFLSILLNLPTPPLLSVGEDISSLHAYSDAVPAKQGWERSVFKPPFGIAWPFKLVLCLWIQLKLTGV